MSGVANAPGATTADLAALQQQIAGKADASALASKADLAAIPQPATSMPPAVQDSGAKGDVVRYALENHTHASKARKGKATVSTATYTWTYPTAFPAGVAPIVNAIAQVASGNTDLFNVQVIGVPGNASCQFQINRVSSGLLSLLLGALSINPAPASITLHMIALEP